MPPEIEQKIRALRDKYLNNDDSQRYLDDVDAEIRRLVEEKQTAQNPVFQSIMKDAQQKINEINVLLLADVKYTDHERDLLLREKRVWRFVFDRFGLTPHDEAIKLLTVTLDQKLSQ